MPEGKQTDSLVEPKVDNLSEDSSTNSITGEPENVTTEQIALYDEYVAECASAEHESKLIYNRSPDHAAVLIKHLVLSCRR